MPDKPISDNVNVSINIAAGAVQQQGFGNIMLLGQSTVLDIDEILTATSAASWTAEGGATTDEEYKALNAIFSQEPSPLQVKVARRNADTSAVYRVTFASDFQSGGTVEIAFTYTDVAGNTVTETMADTAFNTSHAQTVTDVTAALLALTSVTAVGGTDTAPGAQFDITIDPALPRDGTITFTQNEVTGTGSQTATTAVQTAPVTLTDRLGTLATEDAGWYILGLTHVGTDNQRIMDTYRAAAWVEGNTIDAVHLAQTDLSAVTSGTADNIAKVLKAASYNRTHILFHPESEYADMALAGRYFSINPDVQSIDMYRLRLSGITTQDYTPTQRSTLEGDYVGYYTTQGGTARFFGGQNSSGRYMDEQVTLDWYSARVAEDVLSYLNRGADSNLKRTYTDRTTGDIEGLLVSRWENGVDADHFAATKTAANGDTVPGITVTRGLVSAESAANRTARTYAGLSATIKLAGSIRNINPITITLEV